MGNRDPRIRHTLATVVCVAILAWGAPPARSASTPTTHPTGAGRAAAGAGRVASPPAPSTGEAGVRGRRPRRRHRRRRRPRRRTRFDARVRLGGYYDSNVFDYSDADRATFEGATAPLPRFPISSLGDYVTTVAARADWTRRTARRTAWRLRLRYDGRLHVRNGERDRHGFGLELRRRGRHSETTLSTSLTPRIYLRHLYARSQAAYAPAEFLKAKASLTVARRVARRTWWRVFTGFARRDYDAPFDERDNDTWSAGTGLERAVGRRVRLDASVAMSWSSAAGAGSPDSLATDISNRRFTVRGGLDWVLGGGLRLTESLAFSHQSYTTGRVADRFHHGRTDDELYWKNALWLPRQGRLRPRVFVDYRRAATSTGPGVPDVGQFTGLRVGAVVTVYLAGR